MRKLTLLITTLFLSLGMAWAQELGVSTNVGNPERQYFITNGNNIKMASNTAPTQNNPGKFAFFKVDGDNAYKIYSIGAGKWVSYDKTSTTNDTRNFATLVNSQDGASAWQVTTVTIKGGAKGFHIVPFNADGTTSARYWNWNGGVGTNGYYSYDDKQTVGLWRDAATADAGSGWILTEEVEYSLTDMAGNTYEWTSFGTVGVNPTLPGAAGATFEGTWDGNKYTATINFPFPVSKEGGVINMTTIASAADAKKWCATDNAVIMVQTSGYDANDNDWLWAIYPQFANGAFSFKIKSIGKDKWIYTEASGSKVDGGNDDDSAGNAAGAVQLTNVGTSFDVVKSNSVVAFHYMAGNTNQYLSINSKNDTKVFLGVHTGTHIGTDCYFDLVKTVAPVAKIGDTPYYSLAAAVKAAQAGAEIVVVADIADVTVDVTKNLTISGAATLNNVGINANGADALTVKGLTFTGNSWINSGTAEALTVSGITATVKPSNTNYTNSRSAFISLGRSEGQELALTVENSNITVTAAGADAILGWAKITAATITGNVIKGSSDGYFTNADAIKFMSIANGAEFVVNNNEIYSNYNGIVFAQNTTRDNAYSVSADANKFYGGADHIWIEITGGNTVHATFNATSANTVNGNAFTVNDIKYHGAVIKNWTSYAGVDVVTDANGKVIGGTLAEFSNAESVAEGYEIGTNGAVGKASVAEVNGVKYASFAEAVAAASDGDEIVMLADATLDAETTLPAGVTLNGNGKQINGNLVAGGNLTFKGATKVTSFNAGYNKPIITIGEGATLEMTTGRMVIGHGATFNITGNITDAKTANVADVTPSLVMPGASFTGAGVTFNVTNAYIKTTASYCSSSKSASGTFDFNINNSIWEQFGKLAFESQSTAATVNFDLKNSVLNTGSHLVFGVSRGEVVIDNSNVNVGKSNQIENQSTMTIKNGSVVNGAVATSSNAKNPGTIIVENATYAVSGEFSGSDLGTGTLVIKKDATVSAGSITKANITVDAEGMTAGDEINFAANLSQFTGTLSVINNDKLEAKIVDGKVVLAAKPVAMIGEQGYATIKDAVAAVKESETITILAGTHSEGTIKLPATLKNVTIKGESVARSTEGAVLKDMTISAADGNAYSYVGLTFDGITFDNSRILLTGWRNGDETIKNLAVTNCTFKNLNDNTNSAPVHINKDAAEAVNGFTFTNNVIDGATGGQKSGIYLQATGNVVVSGNVINNVSFRPYVIQVTTDDGIADNFTVTGNTFSGSAAGRAQGLGNNAEGTDNVNLVVSDNIFKGITDSQQICYWNFNPETTTADLSKNYYDIDIVANPSKIYFNSAAADNYALRDMNVFPIYTALNENGTINTESAFTPKFYIAKVGENGYETLSEAFAAVKSDDQTVVVLKDVTENLTASLRGNITTENGAKVTITLTNSSWVNCPYTFVIGENVTLKVPALFYYAGGTQINGTVIANAYYQRYPNTKLTINEPGSMTVTTEQFYLRYVDGDANAGIYIIGDNNDETTGLNLAVAYFYQGMINAKDANIKAGTYWQTNDTDGQGSANLVLDNSKLVVSVYDHPAKATGNSTVTLTNGSVIDAKNGGFTYGDNTALSIDATSKIIGKNGALVELPVATINGKKYTSLQAAIDAVQNGETIILTDNVAENVVIKEKDNVKVTIDGKGKTMTGAIKVVALSSDNDRRITIKDLNFVDATSANVDFISSVETNHYPRLTVEGCTFTGSGDATDVAVRLKSSKNVEIKNCTGTGLHSFIQNTSGWNLTIEGVTVTNSKSGFALGTVQGVTVKGANIDVAGYGIRMDAQYNNNAVIESNTVKAFIPVVVRKAEVNSNVTVQGTNTFTATNTDGLWMAVGASEYETNGTMPTAATGKVKVTLNDTGLSAEGVYGNFVPVAKIGNVEYTSLEAAFKAATSGCTIDILSDVTVDSKWDCRYTGAKFTVPVTINGNGKTIKFTAAVNDQNWNTVFRFEENATVKNLTVDISNATGAQRVISAKKSLNVDGLNIVGAARYGVIYGEGASATDLAATEIVVKNSTLGATRRAVSDNEGGKDVKSVVIEGNTFNANVYVSASESIAFNNNTVNGETDLRSYAADNVLNVQAQDNTLTADKKNYIYAKTIVAQEGFETKNPPLKVATKAELQAALAAAKDGDVITLTADIDYGTDQLAITKAITLDLGGKTLTTRNAWGGMSIKGNPTVKNGNIVHASNTAAIKVWNATAFEDLVIDVQGKGDANKTIGGIVLQSGSTTKVGSIKNVTIKGAALTNGIETYNCGDATENVIGAMENVTIDAQGTGLLISAPCGTATNCNIKGGTNGIELWIKGNYSASLELVASTVDGGVYAHDEFNSTPGIVNNGTLKFTADEATTGASAADVTLEIARAEADKVQGVLTDVMVNAKAKLNNVYYATFAEAFAAAKAGDTVTLLADLNLSEILVINKAITLDGNGKKLTSTAARAINVDCEGNVGIKNLTIDAKGERAINVITKPANVTVENVTATAANYTVNVAGSAANAVVTVKNSNLTGLNVVNVAAAGAKVTVTGGTLVCNDQTDVESYAALFLNENAKEATITATGVTFDIKGDSKKAHNAAADGTITIDGKTEDVEVAVAYISYGDNAYTFNSIEAAIAKAEAGETVVLLRDITASEIITINKAITLDGNGKTLTSTAGRAINVDCEGNVGIKNLTINASGERAINVITKPANVAIENVTATAANYTVNVATSAGAAKVAISKSTLNGLCTVNVAAAGAQVTIENSTVNCNDNNTTAGESYAALCLNKAAVGGSIVATNSTINVTDGSDSTKGRNGAEDGTVTIDGSTEGVSVTVAVITYEGSDYYHGFSSLAEAVEFAKAGDVITLIRDITTSAQININKNVAIDGKGKKLTVNAARGFQITGGTVAISNLTIDMPNAAEGNRGINLYNGDTNAALDVTLNNVTVNGGKAYAVNIGGGKDNKLTINGSTLTGYAAINVHTSSVNHTIVVDGSTLNGKNHNNDYHFATVVVDGTNAHSLTITNTTINNENLEGITNKYDKVIVGPNCTLVWDGNAAVRNVMVNGLYYTDLQAAIKAAAPNGTVEILGDITVDKWITISETLTIGDGSIITLKMDGLTINGNGHTLTIKEIESPEREDFLFHNATNLNVKDLTISCVGSDVYDGGISLKKGTIENVTFNGGKYAVLPGAEGVTVTGCTFNGTTGYAIYFEDEREGIVVTGNTFNTADGAYAITMRSNEQFTNNTVVKGRVNIANSSTATVTGNDFGTERFKVYNAAAATIKNNEINNLVFNDTTSEVKATFADNTLSTEAEAALGASQAYGKAAKVNGVYYTTVDAAIKAAQAGQTVTILAGTYPVPAMKAGITVEGEGEVLLEGTLSGTLENLTLKNLHIKGGNAQRWAYAKGNLLFENVTFEATSVYALHFDGITEGTNLTYKNCTIIGWAALGGSPASCVFDGCTIKDNGTYGVIRTYFDTTIENCTFNVANANTTDAYQDGIHAVEGAIVTVNNCTNDNGTMKDLVNVDASSVVTVDGKEYKNVAEIGETQYITIDDAIAAWTNNTTLTLLADVTLTDVVTLKSTEHHILNLSTFTMTAADGKNAFEIIATGTGDAERTAITIKADANNPGGINAGSKSIVYYDYSKGTATGNDRPIIKIEGGVFTASTSSWGTAGIYTKGTAARKCATLNITGGTFNCSINGQGKSKLIISGGVFNYSVGSQGDSTALRLISGGTFKTFGFMTADSNNTKFWFGTSMANSNVGVHVDDNGYIVVGGPVVTEAGDKFEASSTNYSGASNLLQYSSAKNNGLYYTSVKEAFADNNTTSGKVTVYADEIDMTGITFKGSIIVPEGEKVKITNAPADLKVATAEGYFVDITIVDINTNSGVYESKFAVAKIGEQNYASLAEALTAAKDGETVNLLWKDGQAPLAMNGSVFGKNVTITGTAKVDWSKGFLFVGRGGEGNATVTFDGANLTSASNSASYGIHVSGREKNTNNKYDGTLVIKNSSIELDYLINKGAMTLDNATLTVKNGFAIGGRPASETESGADATATISLTNGSKVVVNNHNGMGLGYEAIGVMNIDATSTFETTQSFLVTAKGTMNVAGKASITGTLTNNGAIVLTDAAATLTSTECNNVTTNVADYKVVYADGAYKVVAKNYVAKVGDAQYETLAEALAAAQAGATITLVADVTEDVTLSKAVTIDGADKTYTGKMTVKADATIKNANFDGKGYNGYAVETRGANYLTIEGCTAKNYGYGFVQLASATALTTVKDVTVSNMNYGVKVDYSNAVVLENVDITVGVAALLNSNYGEKTITIKNSKLNILGTWKRNETTKTTYVFEGANIVDDFTKTVPALDIFKNAAQVVGTTAIYGDLNAAFAAVESNGTVKLLGDFTAAASATVPAGKVVTLDLNGKTVSMVYDEDATANHTMINNLGDLTIESSVEGGKLSYTYTGKDLGTTYAANTITSEPGSVLTVKSGTIENLTFDSGVIAYAIDGRTNGGNGDVTVNIEGGVITSKRQAVRIFANSTTNTGALNISGGDFTGRVIVQNASAKANKAALNITGGTFNANDYKSDVLYVGGSESATIDINAIVAGGTFKGEITETNVAGFISGGTFANPVAAQFCAEGFMPNKNADGTYGVVLEAGVSASGTWGGIDWTLTYGGTLTIAPTAGEPVPDVNAPTKRTYKVGEWREAVIYKSNGSAKAIGGYPYDVKKVKKLIIEEGVTKIGSFTAQFPNLTGEVVIPSTVTYIGQEAFYAGSTNTTQNISKITFAAGGTAPLCIANGAFKSVEIEEIAFPGDRESLEIHHWAFGGSPNLKSAYIPANLKKSWGGEHVDYFDNFNSQSNVTWAEKGSIFTGCTKMETITFENKEVRDLFFAKDRQATADDYIVAAAGLVAYNTVEKAIEELEDGDDLFLVKSVTLKDTWAIPAGMNLTLNLNGKTMSQSKACTESYEMISNKGNLTITGNGKISFTDTSAGDPNFGWGSYTVRNEGNLVVENGTIEHLGTQTFATHMICAIFQYSGSTTINGGKISTPNYRSVRLWHGDMTINGGEFDGQVWVQAVDDSANLTINGGTFEPNGGDASAVFVSNADKNVALAVTDGTFNGKVGCSDATKLAGAIAGGKFTEAAKNGTNSALIAAGSIFGAVADADGYYAVEDDPATHYINNVEEFLAFRDAVNGGNDFAGVAVYLAADIDLAGIDWSVNIGDDCNATFDGTFDGQGHTIKNLTSTETAQKGDGYICTGLFGAIHGGAVLKNFTVENVNISTGDFTGNNVAAVVGFAYQVTGSIENVKVTGNININAANVVGVGAIIGYDYRSPALKVENCAVSGNDGSVIVGKSYVGGAVGYASNKIAINNNTVENVSVTATASVGAIAGIMLSGSSATGNIVENVALTATGELWANSAAVVAGTITSGGVTVANTTVVNVTANGAAAALVGGQLVEKPTAPIAKVEAKIGDKYYTTLENAYVAAQAGATVELLAPVVIASGETLTLDKDVTVVYTSNVAGEDMFTNRGTLNISAGTITYANTDATGSNVTVSTISSEPGSVLNITGGTVENKTVKADGSSIYSFAIDMLTNGNLGDVTATISGGTVYSDYMAIRQFNNGDACKNTLTINGGYIYGAKRAVQVHLNNNAAYTTISGGKVEAGADGYAICNFAATGNLEVTGGEFIGAVYSARENFISGGTYNNPVEAAYCAEGYMPNKNTDGTYGVVAAQDAVAAVGGFAYATLADAVKAAKAGEVITLLQDVKENVTINKNLTIDGAGKTITGMITTDGKSLKVTIKNVNFDGDNKQQYYAVKADHMYSLTIQDCTAKNYAYGFLYANRDNYDVTVKDVTVENCANYGAYASSVSGSATFENFTVKGSRYGVLVANKGTRNVNFKNVTFEGAEVPLYINENGTGKVTFTFEGVNEMSKAEFYTSQYVNVVAAAQAGTKVCGSLNEALTAAVTGDTVTLLSNISLTAEDAVKTTDGKNRDVLAVVNGKEITLDMNDKKISVDHQSTTDRLWAVIYVEDGAGLTVTGNGSIDVDANDNTPKVVYMFLKNGSTGYLVIENGNFHMDNSEDSMVFSSNSNTITVKGGTFILDAAASKPNGWPVFFGVNGTNTGYVNVLGGTYNYDITQQANGEVKIGSGYTIRDNGDDTWSVVTGITLVDGEFTEYTNDKTQEVEYISYTRNSIPTTWTPFYVPFEVDVEQLADQGFEVAYINGVRRDDTDYDGELDKFVMEIIYIHSQEEDKVDGSSKTLKANYPYFIRSYGDERIDLNIVLEDAMLYAATDATYDCTTMTERFELIGNLSKVTIKASDDTALRYVVSGGEWSKRTKDSELNPFRFSMELTSRIDSDPTIDAPAMMSIAIRGEQREDGTTLIYDVEMDETQDVDYIYDLQGRRVLEPEKGNLYIINGKKVIF